MMYRVCILLLFIWFKGNYGCPIIITNDSPHRLIVVDPYNKQSVHIDSGEKREINPSVSGWPYYFNREKLDIYVLQQNHPHLFYRQYQLQEKYCTKNKTELSFYQIVQFVTEPTKRFEVLEFEPHVNSIHAH